MGRFVRDARRSVLAGTAMGAVIVAALIYGIVAHLPSTFSAFNALVLFLVLYAVATALCREWERQEWERPHMGDGHDRFTVETVPVPGVLPGVVIHVDFSAARSTLDRALVRLEEARALHPSTRPMPVAARASTLLFDQDAR